MLDFIPGDDLKSYELLFLQYSKNSRIDATSLQTLMAQSGLPNQVLGSIWNLSVQNGNSITFAEFALAMHLSKSVLNGAQLPSVLPPNIRSMVDAAMVVGPPLHNQTTSLFNSPSSFAGAGSSTSSSYGNINDIRTAAAVDPSRDWAVQPDEKQRYDQIFKSSDAGSLGYISGDVARSIFSQSGLRENMLAHIWQMCDMQNRGKLNSDEFAVAMHLIYKKLNGYDLPQKLSDNLIPPSQRALSSLSNLAKLDALQQQPQKRISPSSSLLSISSAATQDRVITPEPLHDPILEEREREIILKQVEAKKIEVAKSKEVAERMKKQLLAAEKEVRDASQQSAEAAKELKRLQPRGKGTNIDECLSISEIASFRKLENDIPTIILECRKLCTERAKNRIQKINDTHSALADSSSSQEVVVNKAAALLAERMAALGVKSTLPSQGKAAESPATIQKTDKKELLLQVEQEKLTTQTQINEFESRFALLSAKIRLYITHKSSSTAPGLSPSLYENGIGLISKEAINLYQSLKHIRETALYDNPPVPKEVQSIPPKPTVAPVNFSSTYDPTGSADHRNTVAAPLKKETISTVVTPSNADNYMISSFKSNDPHPVLSTIPVMPSKIIEAEKVIPFNDSIAVSVLNDGVNSAPSTEEPQSNLKSAFQLMKEKEQQSLEGKRLEEDLKKKRGASPKPFQKSDLQSPVKNLPSEATLPLPFKMVAPLPPKVNPFIPKDLQAPLDTASPRISSSAPPPPPPLPPMNSDGSVVAIPPLAANRIDSSASNGEKKKPSPSDVGAKGPNLFALMNPSVSQGNGFPKLEISKPADIESEGNAEGPEKNAQDVIPSYGVTSPSVGENSEWEVVTQVSLKTGEEDANAFHYEVVVEFDYEATAATDLAASKGEVLKVQKEDEEWIFCRNSSGANGWIPRSFTKFLESQSVDELRAPEDIVLGSAEVMFDFEARNTDELTCLAGQVVLILSKPEEDWWLVEHSGQKGLIPSNFLEERTAMLKGINDVEAIKDASLERSPFGSTAMLFSPSASEFPTVDDSDEGFSGSAEEVSRKEAVSEMLKTERSYMEDLQIVKTHFYAPMTKMSIDMLLLFSNLLQIVEINTAILNDFEVALLEGESIGSAFLKHLDNLQCYKMYCENLSGASTYLQKLRSSNPAIQQFLKSQQNLPACKHLDLSSYLLIPMQRITRYALLLRQILHYTPKTHREFDSSMIALQMSEELLDQINNAIKFRQSALNIDRISKTVDLEIPSEHFRLDLKAPTRKMGNRVFLYEGVLMKSKSGRKLTAYLFNDFLLLVHLKGSGPKPYALYKQPLMLDALTVKDHAESDSFQLDFEEQSIHIRALSISEKRQWINQIASAKKAGRDLDRKKTNPSKLNPNSKNIGTLSVLLCEARTCLDTQKTRDIFALGQIKDQVLKSKVVPLSFQHAKFNQKLIFTLPTLDEVLQISLYRYSKYSADVYLGQAEIQLDILEYYAGKQTDEIELPLKDGGFKTLVVRLSHKT